MLRRPFVAVLVLALAAFIGCKDPTQETIAEDMSGKLKEVATTLQGVKDEASAKAAGEKLKSISADMKKLKEQSEKLPKSTPEQEKKIRDKLEKDADGTMQTIMKESVRIMSDPKLSPPISAAMEDMGKVMK